jgi:hypothetical protein
MKVALLLFGQPRFIENAQTLYTYRNIIKKYDADVFCHVWHQESGSYPTSTCSTLNGCDVHKNAIDIIKENYKPKAIAVETGCKFFMPLPAKAFLDARFTNRAAHWNEHNYSCVLSQMYSIQSVSRLFEQYEAESQSNYDWIILGRFDGLIKSMPILNDARLPKNKFYISDQHPNFPDLVFCYARRFCDWSSNVFDDVESVYHTIWEPSCEAFKSGSFYKRFTRYDIIPTHMKCDLVRK